MIVNAPREAETSGHIDETCELPERTFRAQPRVLVFGATSLSISGLLQLAASTIIFLFAAAAAKGWALQPGMGRLVLTLALYSAGNLIMLRLVREFGMASAFSLSAVIQLVAVNVIALAYFGEKLGAMQSAGLALAVVAVGLITLGPLLGK
jgi:hypothetical protein